MNDQVIGLAACNAWARAKHFGCPSVIPSVCYPGIRVGADYKFLIMIMIMITAIKKKLFMIMIMIIMCV